MTGKLLNEKELDELWSWAPLEANREARRRNWGGDYTLEEKELGVDNVVTGLKRRLEVDDEMEEEGEEEGEEEEEKGEDHGERTAVQAIVPDLGLNDVLRFTTTGAVSTNTTRSR